MIGGTNAARSTYPQGSDARIARVLRRALASLMIAAASGAMAENCPGDTSPVPKECERTVVYRIQTWPALLTDANQLRMDSLTEANAADLKAFRDVLVAYGKPQPGAGPNLTLALRFEAWRLVGEPNNYCNCNFEVGAGVQAKACKAPIAKQDLQRCVRACWQAGNRCVASGVNPMQSGGHWYAFPAGTEYRAGMTWAKNVFLVKPTNADWSASPPKIKRAECVGRLIDQSESLDVDALFTDATPCADVTPDQLDQEALKRD